MRRRPPPPGPLVSEIRTVLAAAGLPCPDTAERDRAHGAMVTANGDAAIIEWFVSRSLRSSAADEQLRGIPAGLSGRAHEAARRHLHGALVGILADAGYAVHEQSMPGGDALTVEVLRGGGPTTLAADVRRIIAHLESAGPGQEPE